MRKLWLLLILFVNLPAPLFALTVAGTGDSEALLQRLGVAFSHRYPDIKVEVPPSVGSSGGIRMLLQGRTDLARVARPLKTAEARRELSWQKFAVVPVLFVANLPERCVGNLNSKQVLDIFSGLLTHWSQLGDCPDHKIYLARREEGDSSNRALRNNITGFAELKKMAGKTIYTTPEAFQTLVEHPYTLGYLPQSQILDSGLRQFSLNGVAATAESISDGSYPLRVPLALVWKEPLSEEARKFQHFLSSPEAQRLISAFGAIPSSERGR